MVKVLLVYSNVMKESWVPIGLMYIAANLRANGIDVKIIDTKFDDVMQAINLYDPTYVGLGGMTVMSQDAIEWGERIKSNFPHIQLIFGGVHFTFIPDDAKPIADIIVKGEAEKVFVEICKGGPLSMIKGIIFKCGDRYIDNGQWQQIEDLDSLPLPAYDLIDISRYSDELVTGEKAVSIMTGRGCPYNCAFCASPKLWRRRVRYHSVSYTIGHIMYLINNYNLKNLRIMDDTFTCNNDRVIEFCKALKRNNINLKMTCLTNVNNANYEIFKLMKDVGFDIVAFGLESVDETVLKLVDKNITEEKARRAIELAHKAGLRTELLFMVGNMGDTKESLEKSLAFSKTLGSYKVYFQLATPFPGSRFYDIAEKYGTVVDRDWKQYNHKTVKYIPFALDADTMYDVVKRGIIN